MFSFLAKCMLLSLGQLLPIWESKPKCIGEPLKPEHFSNEETIGFIRDVFVDILARNIYNSLEFPVSQSCVELANMKTATLSFKWLKWKRSSKKDKHIKVLNEVMDKAKRLSEDLLDVISKNGQLDTTTGEFLYERTNHVKRRLIDSGTVAEDSNIVDQLEDMKIFLCRRCAITDNKDLKDAVNNYESEFELRTWRRISKPRIEDIVVDMVTIIGTFRLTFSVGEGANTQTGSVIMKIPSLASFYHSKGRHSLIYKREAQFYGIILPALYQIGECEPFAPSAIVSQGYALILDDLSVKGYRSRYRIQSLYLDQGRSFLHVLAQYHAFGYKYYHNYLAKDDPIKHLVEPHQLSMRRAISKDEFKEVCKMVKPLLSESLYQKIIMAENKIQARLPMKNEDDQYSMNVIMHGDLRRKNILHKHDINGNVSGVKLINWRKCTLGNPALDLIEFFVQNFHQEIFEANENNLLDYYIAQLDRNLLITQSVRTHRRCDLDRDMKFFKYYYFKVLSDTAVYWRASLNSENYEIIARNIAKWIKYLDKKGFI